MFVVLLYTIMNISLGTFIYKQIYLLTLGTYSSSKT